MAVTPQLSRDWLKIGHRYSLGIKGFRNLKIERILSELSGWSWEDAAAQF